MATDSRQMTREELQVLADKVLKRREQQRERQRKIRQEKRAAGMQSSTHWHPAPPEGFVPVVVFAPRDMAKRIAGNTPRVAQRVYKQEVVVNGLGKLQDVTLIILTD